MAAFGSDFFEIVISLLSPLLDSWLIDLSLVFVSERYEDSYMIHPLNSSSFVNAIVCMPCIHLSR